MSKLIALDAGHGMNTPGKRTPLYEDGTYMHADDFKIFCRDYNTAQKIFKATQQWLVERLGLDINSEKSKITNVRKGKTEFLGFALCVKMKRNKFVTRSNISNKAKKTMELQLKEQIKAIQHEATTNQVLKLNAMILGMHNYYNIATHCSQDFAKISYIVSKSLHNRFKRIAKKVKGRSKMPVTQPKMSKVFQKFYGSCRGKPIIVAKVAIFPIYGCKFKILMNFSQEINKYTVNGRQLIHNKLSNTSYLVRYLLDSKEYDKSVAYNDNRISLMAGQDGKCGATGIPLAIGNMECHHKKPKNMGGKDDYRNLVWLRTEVHELVHATQTETINRYLQILNIDKKALCKVNSLRLLAGNLEIMSEAI